MKKIFIVLFLACTALTSCTSTQIQSQEMPPMEQEWANTLLHWYPDWTAPVIIHK
ncbi:MAG: hypothetical protein NE330_20855 [Lentisphaeraceae bacterium]|nr:hypothetical protein [Lentisphaeraceae bacterium]MCM8534569.1 hypothetical protein [Lentisphaeraceae bacterium]